MKKNIFVALDFSNFDRALDVANSVKNDASGLKITNELFAICGKEGLKKFSDFGLFTKETQIVNDRRRRISFGIWTFY